MCRAAECGDDAVGLSRMALVAPVAPMSMRRVAGALRDIRVVTEAVELSQARVVTGWERCEQSGRPHRRQLTLSHHLDACNGGADQPGWLGGCRALRNLSMGGCSCMFLHPPLCDGHSF